jgi:hypothetical protein
MNFTRDHLIQFARWFFVSVSIALCAWMLVSMGQFIGSRPLGWLIPLEGILFLAFMAPFGMIAYFGIRGDYRRLFTTVIFVICFVILVATSLGLSRFHFTDLIKDRLQPGLLEAFAGVILSSLQVIAPFIPPVMIFRFSMSLLSKISFPTDQIQS